VTFHEEAAFRRAKELPCDSEEQEAPPLNSSDSPLLDEQREETSELPEDPSRDTIEFPMELPPIKRNQLGAGKYRKKHKNIQLLRAPSEKARNQISTPSHS
jgi:hypothetical protein